MRVTSCGITDVGLKRNHNEDNYLINDELNLFVVADGMGGHQAGEVASEITVTTIRNGSSYVLLVLPRLAGANSRAHACLPRVQRSHPAPPRSLRWRR